MRGNEGLFSKYSIFAVVESRRKEMREEVGSLSAHELAATDDAQWCDIFEQKYKFDVPRLLHDKIERGDTKELALDVSGNPRANPFGLEGPIIRRAAEITFYVPFEGDGQIFFYQPSQHYLHRLPGSVLAGELVLTYLRTDQDGVQARREFDNDLSAIQQHLTWMDDSVRQFNISLRSEATKLLTERRIKLQGDREMDAAIGYPLRRRADAPQTYVVPTVRRKPAIVRPADCTKPSAPEPMLRMAEYEHILDVISSMVHVIERSPQAFRDMKEEEIRQHFLVQLNGQYEGQATGETFNLGGRSDILIRAEDKNIFIAECKFWEGPESLRKAVDQLLGYTCWRDTKTALLIFNRDRQLSTVLEKIPEVIKQHPNFERQEDYKSETGFRFVLHHRDDDSRELYLTVLVFEIPS